MGIQLEDHRKDVEDRHLVAVLARLTISPTIVDCMRKTKVDNQLPDQWFTQGTYSRLVKDVDGSYRLRG